MAERILHLPHIKLEDRGTTTAGPLLQTNRGHNNKDLTRRSHDHSLHRSGVLGIISKLEERTDNKKTNVRIIPKFPFLRKVDNGHLVKHIYFWYSIKV